MEQISKKMAETLTAKQTPTIADLIVPALVSGQAAAFSAILLLLLMNVIFDNGNFYGGFGLTSFLPFALLVTMIIGIIYVAPIIIIYGIIIRKLYNKPYFSRLAYIGGFVLAFLPQALLQVYFVTNMQKFDYFGGAIAHINFPRTIVALFICGCCGLLATKIMLTRLRVLMAQTPPQ
ncbi:hypothetical protein [Pseudaquidulcibacter saccharophilus]|uniref:hypothetical protein n=1 Tax=Pseudaquidulcibacter saccharophilus TaxID=2831900 RepID=UPI001EFF296A|nr:hypothetical protein [Pseudaquidulcibacter saccharophilus]